MTVLSVHNRFWSKVDLSGDCWMWTGAGLEGGLGYGKFHLNGKARNAHRVAWEELFGPVPTGLQVCHSCDNRGCVRPSHLFVGTQFDNMADARSKDRMHPRERHGMARLTVDQVRVVRSTPKGYGVGAELARRFGVHRNTIYSIWRGDNWTTVR